METLKKLFPYSFAKKKKKESLGDLIVKIIVYLLAGVLGGILIGILGNLPLIGFVLKILGGLIDFYVLVGIILAVLDYMNVLK